MFESGAIAYYRRPEDSRALRCEIISYADGCYTVKAMRTATCSRRQVLTIPESQVLPVSVVRPEKKYRREYNSGGGLSVTVAESIHRKEIGVERLGMDEGTVLFSEPMQRLCRQIVRRLGSFNGIRGNDNPELHELQGEFLVSALQAIRTATSKATTEDLDAFRQFLAGQTVTSKIMLTVARTGKTAVIRYLKKRQQYHQTHVDIYSLERRRTA